MKGKELVRWCPHPSFTGAERPIPEMGRWPILWACDSCGALEIDFHPRATSYNAGVIYV